MVKNPFSRSIGSKRGQSSPTSFFHRGVVVNKRGRALGARMSGIEVDPSVSSEDKADRAICTRSLIVYVIQVSAILMMICVCVANLSLHDKDKEMWLSLLCTSMGYLLPSPKVKRGVHSPLRQ